VRCTTEVFAASRSPPRRSNDFGRFRALQRAASSPSRVCSLDPVEIERQRLDQFRDRARERTASVEAQEIQAAELFQNFVLRHRLEQYRQQPLR
jgi:hypothetical protein